MEAILVFIIIAVGFAGWWLWREKILDKPWTTEGTETDLRESIGTILPTRRTGLALFLAVVTSVFALLVSAYFTRMELNDWHPVQEPGLLWFNTVLLILASVSIHWCSRSDKINTVKLMLLATGVFTVFFIGGQFMAWQQLVTEGYYLQSNPANAFFYLFTGLHGLHLLGGLWVWFGAMLRVFTGVEIEQAKISVQLCRTYWHFLLVVWMVIFALLLST